MNRSAKLQFVTFLTFARFPLVLLFFAGAIVHTNPGLRRDWLFFASFVAMVLSAATDLFDGYLARKWKVTTTLGAHADPLMDKFFLLAALPLLVFVLARNGELGHATFMLVLTLFFLARDQWITFLRSIGSLYNVSGKANWSGKLRTAINFPMLSVVYYYAEAPEWAQVFAGWFVYAFEAFAMVITFISIFVYTRHYWPYLRKSTEMTGQDD